MHKNFSWPHSYICYFHNTQLNIMEPSLANCDIYEYIIKSCFLPVSEWYIHLNPKNHLASLISAPIQLLLIQFIQFHWIYGCFQTTATYWISSIDLYGKERWGLLHIAQICLTISFFVFSLWYSLNFTPSYEFWDKCILSLAVLVSK